MCKVNEVKLFVIKILLLVIAFFFLQASLTAQMSPDKYKQRFETLEKKSKLDKKELKELLTISDRTQSLDLELSINYLNRALKIYEKQKDYYFISEYAEKISLVYMIKGEPGAGKKIIDQLVKKYEDKFEDDDWMKIQILYVRFLEHTDQYDECIALIDKLLPKTENPLYKSALYTFRGGINMDKSHYDVAAKDYYNALRLSKQIGHKQNVMTLYNRLGLLNHNLKNFEKAKKYFKLALDIAEQAKSERDLTVIYLNMGNLYQKIDSLDLALYYYDKNLEQLKKINNSTDIARNYLNRGNVFLKQKKYDQAFDSFEKSLEICNQFGIGIGKMHNYFSFGRGYIETKQYNKALNVLDSALYYSKELGARDMEMSIHSNYSDAYKALGDYKKALEYYNSFHEIERDLMDDEKQKIVSELEIKYESEIKDQKISQINQTLATKKAENRMLILGVAALVMITGFIIFFLIYRNKTLKQLYERNIELMNSFQFKAPDEEELEIIETAVESEDNLKKIFDRILYALEKEKIYTNPTLSLSDTAEHVKSNDKYVSAAIAEYANMNYSNFVNFYRINEAKRLIYEDGHFNLNEVMYACGFNSRTTFYNAFKKHTGLSPKQFKEMGENNLVLAG